MLTIASFLGKQWQMLTQLSHPYTLVLKNFNLLIKVAWTNTSESMITDINSNTFEMNQLFLVCRILEFLYLDKHKTKGRDTLGWKTLLDCDLDGIPRIHPWYIVAGMLRYLGNSVRPEIQMAVHQTVRFLVNPMRSHKLAIMRIGQYLCNNCKCGWHRPLYLLGYFSDYC